VVRGFETALYRALFRGQSKKRYLHALFYSEFRRRFFSNVCTVTVLFTPMEFDRKGT
jgi:hypothetical protein